MKERFVVAIGSSAGGLEPMKTFFDNTPHDQATYIIIRHIPIAHQSVLHEILQRHSKLEIIEAKDGDLIEKDRVYLPPSSMYMTIKNNRLYLSPRIFQDSTGNWSVNIFLASLAEDKGHKSIAVILSGGGTDGTKGIVAIKNAGGMVIVQQPETCEFSAMPLSAIRTGKVDHILSPAEMPAAILQHTNAILKNANQTHNLEEMGKK